MKKRELNGKILTNLQKNNTNKHKNKKRMTICWH
jgi:hypothetical protein